jgi:hypothetical protein
MTGRMRLGHLVLLALGLALVGCAERVQTIAAGGEKKSDTRSWDANHSVYLAPGWTPGDRASWEAQLRTRAQAQNDYAVAK